jgi:putative addiction module component (TIGR02574 family)
MAYNKEDLLKLPLEERIKLAEELWESIDKNDVPVTEAEVMIAEERYEAYKKNPEAVISWEEFRKKIFDKYGF